MRYEYVLPLVVVILLLVVLFSRCDGPEVSANPHAGPVPVFVGGGDVVNVFLSKFPGAVILDSNYVCDDPRHIGRCKYEINSVILFVPGTPDLNGLMAVFRPFAFAWGEENGEINIGGASIPVVQHIGRTGTKMCPETLSVSLGHACLNGRSGTVVEINLSRDCSFPYGFVP